MHCETMSFAWTCLHSLIFISFELFLSNSERDSSRTEHLPIVACSYDHKENMELPIPMRCSSVLDFASLLHSAPPVASENVLPSLLSIRALSKFLKLLAPLTLKSPHQIVLLTLIFLLKPLENPPFQFFFLLQLSNESTSLVSFVAKFC